MKKTPETMQEALTAGWKPVAQDVRGTFMRAPRRWRMLVVGLAAFGILTLIAGQRIVGLAMVVVALGDYLFGGKREVKIFSR